MIIYTEEQLREALRLCELSVCGSIPILSEDDIIQEVTPIQLPSDEEIWNEGKLVFSEKGKTIYTHYNTVPSWVEGAKWMRNKIQGGNK